MNKDTIKLIKDSTSTFLDIAQMTQHRIKYVQNRDAEDKYKMYKHAFWAFIGVAGLLMMGISGLIESIRYDI